MTQGVAAFALVLGVGTLVTLPYRMFIEWLRIRRAVFANLDSAYANGQFEADGYLHGYTADSIASDLACFADDCSAYDRPQMTPHVRAWMRKRGVSSLWGQL